MSSFGDNFWGEKNNGFFVLFNNYKQGQTSTKEFIDFLRESCTVEEKYSKLLVQVAKAICNNTCVGTFAPFWNLLKVLAEKLSTLHMQLVLTWSDLIKDVARYHEEQHKKYKAMKDSEAPTSEAVQLIQQTTASLHRSREIYHTRCSELERLKRDNASPKDIEKAEGRNKKACEEYKSFVEKYTAVRSDFEGKMDSSCKNLQEEEESHLYQMKDFVETYYKAWENHHALMGQVHTELKRNCNELTVEMLIATFVAAKSTGTEKPRPIQFEEPDLSKLPAGRVTPFEGVDIKKSEVDSPDLGDQPGPLSRSVKLRVSRTWFLKKKRKDKKAAKKKDKDNESISTNSLEDSVGAIEGDPKVDDEGFTIRPDDANDNVDKNSWYSGSSDSESDADDHKLKVEIRPMSTSCAENNIDDIRASVEALRLSPAPVSSKRRSGPTSERMKRSQSVSDTLDIISKPVKPSPITMDLLSTTKTGPNYPALPSPLPPMDIHSIEVDSNRPIQHNHTELKQAFSSNFANFDDQTEKPALPPKTNKTPRLTSLSSLNPAPKHSATLPSQSRSATTLVPPLKSSIIPPHASSSTSSLRSQKPVFSLPKDTTILQDGSHSTPQDADSSTANKNPTPLNLNIKSPPSSIKPIFNKHDKQLTNDVKSTDSPEQENKTPPMIIKNRDDKSTPPIIKLKPEIKTSPKPEKSSRKIDSKTSPKLPDRVPIPPLSQPPEPKTPPVHDTSSTSLDTSVLSLQNLSSSVASPDSGIHVNASTPTSMSATTTAVPLTTPLPPTTALPLTTPLPPTTAPPSTVVPTITSVPRPKPVLTQARNWGGRTSPASFLSRNDHTPTTAFTTTPAIGTSRGPSPLTLGMGDSIPIAVAFTETVNAYFRGTDASKCIVKLTGGLMMSFPAGIVHAFTNNPSPAMLSFRIANSTVLDQVTLNSQLVTQDMTSSTDTDSVYTFDMTTLAEHLRLQADINRSAAYFNIDILKYQVKMTNGVDNTPLPLVCYWKCEPNQTDYRLDYKYNTTSIPPASVLRNVSAAVVVDGDVTNMQSIPSGTWLSEQKRATWKLNDISPSSDDANQGSIRAKFHVNNGPTIPSATAIQFTCDGCTLSGVEFELVGSGYRLSLSKKRFGTGRYLVEPDSSVQYI